MPTSTLKIKSAAAAALTLTTALLSIMPASAATQGDIQTCRAAMTASSHINMKDYRLRFERSEGLRMETIYIKAIPRKDGKAFRFTCTLNRNLVVALNHTGKITRLAAK